MVDFELTNLENVLLLLEGLLERFDLLFMQLGKLVLLLLGILDYLQVDEGLGKHVVPVFDQLVI